MSECKELRVWQPDGSQVVWKLDENGRLIPREGITHPYGFGDYVHRVIPRKDHLMGGDGRLYSMKPPFDDMPPFRQKDKE
jgi:hypothetical protein